MASNFLCNGPITLAHWLKLCTRQPCSFTLFHMTGQDVKTNTVKFVRRVQRSHRGDALGTGQKSAWEKRAPWERRKLAVATPITRVNRRAAPKHSLKLDRDNGESLKWERRRRWSRRELGNMMIMRIKLIISGPCVLPLPQPLYTGNLKNLRQLYKNIKPTGRLQSECKKIAQGWGWKGRRHYNWVWFTSYSKRFLDIICQSFVLNVTHFLLFFVNCHFPLVKLPFIKFLFLLSFFFSWD